MVKGNPGPPRHMVWPGRDPQTGAEPRGNLGLDAHSRPHVADSLKGQQKESGFPLGFPLEAASDPLALKDDAKPPRAISECKLSAL